MFKLIEAICSPIMLLLLMLIFEIGTPDSQQYKYLFSDYRGKWRQNAVNKNGPEITRYFNTSLLDGGILISRGYLQIKDFIPSSTDLFTFYSWAYFDSNVTKNRLVFDLSNSLIGSLYYDKEIRYSVYLKHNGIAQFYQVSTPLQAKYDAWVFVFFRLKLNLLNRTIISVGYFEPFQHIIIENITSFKGAISPRIIQTNAIFYRSQQTYVRNIDMVFAYVDNIMNEIDAIHPSCMYAAGNEEYDCLACRSNLYSITKVHPHKKLCTYNGNCNALCSGCFGANFTDCLSCANNAIMIAHYTCACKERFYYNSEIKECMKCMKGCIECNPEGGCISCDKGYFQEATGCRKCHYLCEECNNPGIEGCTLCIPENGVVQAEYGCKCDSSNNYYLREYRCVKMCNEFSKGDHSIILCNGICEHGCDICMLPVINNCTKCLDGFDMKKDGKCVKSKNYDYLTWVTSVTAILLACSKLLLFFGKKIIVKGVMYIVVLFCSQIKRKVKPVSDQRERLPMGITDSTQIRSSKSSDQLKEKEKLPILD
jgi:hypothetical protein